MSSLLQVRKPWWWDHRIFFKVTVEVITRFFCEDEIYGSVVYECLKTGKMARRSCIRVVKQRYWFLVQSGTVSSNVQTILLGLGASSEGGNQITFCLQYSRNGEMKSCYLNLNSETNRAFCIFCRRSWFRRWGCGNVIKM